MYARVVRGEVLSVKQRDVVQAASVLVVASLQVARLIVAEAAISFLGFGAPLEEIAR